MGNKEASHNANDYALTEAGFVEKNPGERRDGQHVSPLQSAKQAQERQVATTKKVEEMQSTLQKAKEARILPGEKALDAAGMAVVKKIEEMANGLKGLVTSPEFRAGASDTLVSALALLKSQPSLTLAPTKDLVDSLITVGKANKDNSDPFVQADVQELRALVIEMQQKLAAQPVVATAPNVTVNNIFGLQSQAQMPQTVAPEKKEEQTTWQDKGRTLMYQVSSINNAVRQKQVYRQGRIDTGNWTAEDQKMFSTEIEALVSQRKQTLRTVNSLVENARKPSDDRKLIAATREETDLAMNQWILDLQIRGISVKNGAYTVA